MNIFKTTILLSTLLLPTINATAANAPEKESMHTKSGLYVDSVEAHLIFMCRSGSTRSAPAADIFFDRGYANVYSMVDGFEGGKAKQGEHKGARVVSGWKNSGLPWGWKLEKAVMYGINE
jgi:rhodanese-related sulfurtransferase